MVDILFGVYYNLFCVKTVLRQSERLRLQAGEEKRPPGCGSAWLERLVWDQEVAGSNPVTPTPCYYAGVVQW